MKSKQVSDKTSVVERPLSIHILTIFPDLLTSFFSSSLVGKSVDKNLVKPYVSNIRDFASPPHFNVDDAPYGGGPGMVMRPEPIEGAVSAAKLISPSAKVLFPSPRGKVFKQSDAERLSQEDSLIFLCGRYEGVDQRVIDLFVDEELSLGDFVIMGGEMASCVMLEAIIRLRHGVLGNAQSTATESFSAARAGILEAPQFTRPPDFKGMGIPPALLSGDHAAIEAWRVEEGKKYTQRARPDLLDK